MAELSYNELKPRAIIGNFRLVKKIDTFEELYSYLEANKSIFARHRVYPCAFFFNWRIRACKSWIIGGYFYTIERIK